MSMVDMSSILRMRVAETVYGSCAAQTLLILSDGLFRKIYKLPHKETAESMSSRVLRS